VSLLTKEQKDELMAGVFDMAIISHGTRNMLARLYEQELKGNDIKRWARENNLLIKEKLKKNPFRK